MEWLALPALILALLAFVFFLTHGILAHFSQNATRGRLRLIERTIEIERQRQSLLTNAPAGGEADEMEARETPRNSPSARPTGSS